MKLLSIFLTVVFAFLLVNQIRLCVSESYTYEKKYENFWQLADKSSTIAAKQQYIAQFVNALKEGKSKGEFSDYDAVFLKTPNNSFDSNLKAIETLSARLTEIQGMNPSSFEYNTAIQQITGQEQHEAGEILSVFEECYELNSYTFIWQWIGGIISVVFVISFLVCSVFSIILDGPNTRRWA